MSMMDGVLDAAVPVVVDYKTTADTTLDGIASVLDSINGDTLLVTAEKITDEINGEEI